MTEFPSIRRELVEELKRKGRYQDFVVAIAAAAEKVVRDAETELDLERRQAASDTFFPDVVFEDRPSNTTDLAVFFPSHRRPPDLGGPRVQWPNSAVAFVPAARRQWLDQRLNARDFNHEALAMPDAIVVPCLAAADLELALRKHLRRMPTESDWEFEQMVLRVGIEIARNTPDTAMLWRWFFACADRTNARERRSEFGGYRFSSMMGLSPLAQEIRHAAAQRGADPAHGESVMRSELPDRLQLERAALALFTFSAPESKSVDGSGRSQQSALLKSLVDHSRVGQ